MAQPEAQVVALFFGAHLEQPLADLVEGAKHRVAADQLELGQHGKLLQGVEDQIGRRDVVRPTAVLRHDPLRDDLRRQLGRVRDELLEVLHHHHRRDIVGEVALQLVGRLAKIRLLVGPRHPDVPHGNLWPRDPGVKAAGDGSAEGRLRHRPGARPKT